MLIWRKQTLRFLAGAIVLVCAIAVMCPLAAAALISRSDVGFYVGALCEPLFRAQSSRSNESATALEAVESLEKALSQGQQEKVQELLVEILERPHLDSDLLLRVGIHLAERELYREAAQVFARCVEEHPAVFEAYYNLALADVAQQNWKEALATLDRAPRRSSAETEACSYLRGKIEDHEGRTADADRDLSLAFQGAPQNEAYGLDLGLFYIHHHLYPQAIAVFERGERASPNSSFLRLGLALARFLAGQQSQAIGELKKLLAVRPGFAPAELLLTFALFSEGKLADAERLASLSLRSPNPSPYLYYLDASILVKLQSRQYSRIFKELHAAREGIPACSLCYMTESKAHQAQGDVIAAIADLEAALRLDPDFPEAWYRLALLYRRAGRSQEATRAQARFQELRADKEERETQMLRENFLKTMDVVTPAQ